MNKSILLVVVAVLPWTFCSADTTWTGGGGNSSWSNASNWDSGIPDAADNVAVDGFGSSVSITGVTGSVLSVFSDQGAFSLTLTGTGLTLDGFFISSGGFTANVPVTMNAGGYFSHQASVDANFNQLVTIADGDQLAVNTSVPNPPGRILFNAGLAGNGLLQVVAARVVLNTSSSYTGGTEVSGSGVLTVTNASGSATGTGDVTIGDSSQIQGTGTISGNLTCNTNGQITSNLATSAGSFVPLHVGGSLSLDATPINITSVGGSPSAGTYTLVQADSVTGTVVLGTVSLPLGLSVLAPQVVGNTVQITVTGSPIQAWRTSFGWAADGSGANQGNNQDFDGDGFTNLVEYGFNSNPTLKGSVPLFAAAIQNVGGGNRLKITFTRHTSRTDINYIVKAATTVNGTYTNIAQSLAGGNLTDISSGTFAIDQGTGTVRSVTVTDGALVSSNSKRFLKVDVVFP